MIKYRKKNTTNQIQKILKKEIMTILSKTTKSKLNLLKHSESNTFGLDFEFQESIHPYSLMPDIDSKS